MIDIAYTTCWIGSGECPSRRGISRWTQRFDCLPAGEWLTSNYDANITCLTSFDYTRIAVPIISALPLWLRFLQCMRRYRDTQKRHPFISNAGKYAVSHSVILFGVFHPEANAGSTTATWQVSTSTHACCPQLLSTC